MRVWKPAFAALPSAFALALLASILASNATFAEPPETGPAGVEAATKSGIIYDVEQDRLTVQVDEMPLEEVLQAIGEAAEIEILMRARQDAVVSANIDQQPLAGALKELLGRRNFAMQQDPVTKRPTKVWLMSKVDTATLERLRAAARTAPSESALAEPVAVEGTSAADSARDMAKVAEEIRAELRQMAGGATDREALAELGLSDEEQDELLQMLDEMSAGNAPEPPVIDD